MRRFAGPARVPCVEPAYRSRPRPRTCRCPAWGRTRVVGGPVGLTARQSKPARDRAGDPGGVSPNPAPKSDPTAPAELAHIRRHVVPGTPTEYLDRKPGTRVSAALEREQLAHVGAAAGEAEQTTVGIELAAHFRRRQAAALHDIEKRAGVHVPRARAHDQTLD